MYKDLWTKEVRYVIWIKKDCELFSFDEIAVSLELHPLTLYIIYGV